MLNLQKRNKQDTPGLFGKLKNGLNRTRNNMVNGIANLILGKKTIDDELLEKIETKLLLADVGVTTTQEIIDNLTAQSKRNELTNSEHLLNSLQQQLTAILEPCSTPLTIPSATKPYVILVVGVNGSGKTTTIGKLAKKLQQDGKKVMLAAGDTFRAAAIEQLKIWGERNEIAVIAQQLGSDSAAVIYDALQAATARNIDVLIADTAGRLHTQNNLMEELKKIKRVLTKLDPDAPHEVMLILDAGIGQNALTQAKEFNSAMKVTGLTLTKLDGTAKGGIIFSIAKNLAIPIRYIGVGEQIDDLQVFNAHDFTAALFANQK